MANWLNKKKRKRPLWHLWHDVAIRTVFISFTKRCTHLLFLAPVAILQRRHSNKNCPGIDPRKVCCPKLGANIQT